MRKEKKNKEKYKELDGWHSMMANRIVEGLPDLRIVDSNLPYNPDVIITQIDTPVNNYTQYFPFLTGVNNYERMWRQPVMTGYRIGLDSVSFSGSTGFDGQPVHGNIKHDVSGSFG